MENLSAHGLAAQDLARLDAVVADLTLESPLAAALQYVLEAVRSGMGVTLAQNDEQLTPSQAARLLNMSRTHLYKLLDAQALPSCRVGRDRRVLMSDLVEFERRRSADRANLAERFAHAAEHRKQLLEIIAAGGHG